MSYTLTANDIHAVAPPLRASNAKGGISYMYDAIVAGTIPASGPGCSRVGGNANQEDLLVPMHSGVRRLTPLECERLQGFPDGWTEGFSDTFRYRMLGNAVTVNVARWIGNRILEQEVTA